SFSTMLLLSLLFLVHSAFSQTCSGPTIGACPCQAGSTCIPDPATGGGCCPDGALVTTTTGPATTTTAAAATTTVPASTCVDLLNPNTGVSDCPSRAYLCTNSVYYTLMTQQCPKTCGRCTGGGVVTTTASSATCVDLLNPNTGVSDCPSRAYLCNNSAYYTLMTQQCPRTCGRCSGSGGGTVTTRSTTTCVDLLNPSTGVSDCPSRAYLCNNSAYYSLMTQQCPRTCGRCSVGK
ncbi:hypothetical protein PMAYCL1PPCAC_21980, partial [Pristionchus mayeri]